MSDMVNQPPHYKAGGMEAIDVIETFAPGNYHRGNALKYLLRAGRKGATAVDLRKAIWYIEREILKLEPVPLSPRIEERLTKMGTERFAHACPDLDQELPLCDCTGACQHIDQLKARCIAATFSGVNKADVWST